MNRNYYLFRSKARCILSIVLCIILFSSIATSPLSIPKAYASQDLNWNSNLDKQATFGRNSLIIIDSGSIDHINNCENLHGGSLFRPNYVNDWVYSAADIYIVPHREDWGDVSNSPVRLTDVQDAPDTVVSFGGTFDNVLIGESTRIGNGIFDVIYDQCQDGYLNPEDKIFHKAITIDMPSNFGMSRNAKSLAEQTKRGYSEKALYAEAISNNVAGIYVMYQISKFVIKIGAQKYLDALTKIVQKGSPLLASSPELAKLLSKIPFSWESAAVKAVTFVADKVAAHYRSLAADPPNPNFSTIVTLGNRQNSSISSPSNNQLAVGMDNLANEWNNEDAIAHALLNSLEMFQGSQSVGDAKWGLIHAREIKQYSDLLSTQLLHTNDKLSNLITLISADNTQVDSYFSDLEKARNRVLSSGFNASEIRDFRNMGFTESDISHVRDIFVAGNYSFQKQNLITLFSKMAQSNTNLNKNLQNFSIAIDDTIKEIQNNPINRFIDTTPVVTINGPDNGLAGSAITFNGSASFPRDNSTITKYEWDLNGDGQFDDSALASPSFTYYRPFDGYVGLRISNAEGDSSVGYKHISIADLNSLPSISSTTPNSTTVDITTNTSKTFEISASDPDGDSVSTKWFVDGNAVSSGNSFMYNPLPADLGAHLIAVNATDNSLLGGTITKYWNVFVFMPDKDHDGWNANVDCNDTNAAVNPGVKEILYNGIDDDCNPNTLDNNTPPVVQNQTIGLVQNSSTTIGLTGSDVDNGQQLNFTIVKGPQNGTLGNIRVVDAFNSQVTYTPKPNFHGLDSFTFKANDGKEDSKIATTNIHTIIKDSPVAFDQSVKAKEDTPITINLTASNPDKHPLEFAVTGNPSAGFVGNVTSTGPFSAKVTYTPDPNFNSVDPAFQQFNDTIIFTATDKVNAYADNAQRQQSQASVTINVAPVDDLPLITPIVQTVSTAPNTPTNITLRAFDVENDQSNAVGNHGIHFSIVNSPTHGTLSSIGTSVISSGTPYNATKDWVIYTPATNYTGKDAFSFKANDGTADSEISNVTIMVSKPSVGGPKPVFENGDIILSRPLDNNGTSVEWFRADGTFVKSLKSIDQGTSERTGGAFDSSGNLYITEFLGDPSNNTKQISKYNSTGDLTGSFGKDFGGQCPVPANCGGDLMLPESILFDKHGNAFVGGISLHSLGGAKGEPFYRDDDIRKFDPQGKLLANYNAAVENRGNDWIELASDQCTMYYTSEGDHIKRYDVCHDKQLPDFTDLLAQHHQYGNIHHIDYAMRLLPTGGMLVSDHFDIHRLDADGKIIKTYDVGSVGNAPGENGWFSINLDPDSKSFWAASLQSPYVYKFDIETGKIYQVIKTNTGFVVGGVTIKGEPIAAKTQIKPVANDQNVTTNKNTPIIVTLSGKDGNNDPLTFSIVNNPSSGTLSQLVPVNGTLTNVTYTPNSGFVGTDKFTFKTNDGTSDSNNTATVSILVNHPPTAIPDTSKIIEGNSANIRVLANDTDLDPGDTLRLVAISTQPSHGSATINNSNNTVTYTPLPAFSGQDSFSYTVSDNHGANATANVTISVKALNDPPVANSENISTVKNNAVNFTLTGSDPNHDPIKFTSFSGPSNGFVKILNSTTGSATYIPLKGFHGTDAYQFRASDGKLNSKPAAVNVSVTDNGVNDPPKAVSERISTLENKAVVADVLKNDVDPNNDPLTITKIIGPQFGSASVNTNNNTITFIPAQNFIGSDVFLYNITDGRGGISVAQVIVDVTPSGVNHAPTVDDKNVEINGINKPVDIVLTGHDPDGNPLRFFNTTNTANGTISTITSINSSASKITYTPKTNFVGTDIFTYIAADGLLASSNTGTVRILVIAASNSPPIADAGTNQTVNENTTNVRLDGNKSHDPDSGDSIASYKWVQTAGPTVALTGANTAIPTFTAPSVSNDTVLKFSLTVTDTHGSTSNPSTISVLVKDVNVNVNKPPIANAGIDFTVNENTTGVTLNGTASSDPDNGDTISAYSWKQVKGPTVTLSSTTAPIVKFDAPSVSKDTQLAFNLTVTDNHGATSIKPATVNVLLKNLNILPIANAGKDQTVNENTTNVVLDGTGSIDKDGTISSYTWKQIQGPTVSLSSINAAKPTFTAPSVTKDTPLKFNLTVTDNDGGISDKPSTTSVLVKNVNLVPVANAGTNQTVNEDTTTVTLDGSKSFDRDGTIKSYNWKQTGSGSPIVTLANSNTAKATFTAPSVTKDTNLTFLVTVTDNGNATSTSTTNVLVKNVNISPIADAGTNQTVSENTTGVKLDGTKSNDPDGGKIASYSWVQTAGPSVTLTGANTAAPTFNAPHVTKDTTLPFKLTVTDNDGGASSSASTSVLVKRVNIQPTAVAGPNQTVNASQMVTLDGSKSFDRDGGAIASYKWVQTAGSSVTLTGANTAKATFKAPSSNTDTTLTFKLVVTDNDGGANNTATTNVLVKRFNQPPQANAGTNQTVNRGNTVTLDGSKSHDPDGGTITSYQWNQISGSPTVALSGANTANPTFTAPDVTKDTTFSFRLIVKDSDGGASSSPSIVSILVKHVNQSPVAIIGNSQTVNSSQTVVLDGSKSFDPDGGKISSYQWVQTGASPTVILTGANTAIASFKAPILNKDTTLTFKLTVTDNDGGASSSATTNIIVKQAAPICTTATPSQSVLFPPNHKFVNINIQNVRDPDGDPVAITITKIMQDEPVISAGSGNTAPDGTGVGASTAQVRAERDGNGDGRVYHIFFRASDGKLASDAGACAGQVLVSVPHDQAHAAVDGGPLFDSTAIPPTTVVANGNTQTNTAINTASNQQNAVQSLTQHNIINARSTTTTTHPIANAGVSQTVIGGSRATLNGMSSYSPNSNNRIMAYQWTQLHMGVPVTLVGPNTATPTLTTPIVPSDTVLAFGLRVMDNHGGVSTNPAVVYVMVKHNSNLNNNSPAAGGNLPGTTIIQPRQQQPIVPNNNEISPHSQSNSIRSTFPPQIGLPNTQNTVSPGVP